MSFSMESLLVKNPSLNSTSLPIRRAAISRSPSSLRLESLLRPRAPRFSVASENGPPGGLRFGLHSLHRRSSSVIAFAASHEESHSELDVEKENGDLDKKAEESEEAWEQTLDAFKEQALKMQSISQEAYEIYSKKAAVILKETAEQLKIQAEKARYDLSVVAKELSEEGKEYLSAAAEKSPEPVKEIVETFSTPTEDLNDISKVQDFYLGIPYGLLLSVGGFLSFMLTGSISAIRFGVILGGTLLAFSVSSLRYYKRGKSSSLALKGQAGIAGIIFLREIRFLSQRLSFFSFLMTVVSGGMLAFYLYKIKQKRDQMKGPSCEEGMETQ
ncbi:protein FATTY ACID EXPORT 3, chloroplastic isoform X2 [Rhodamnia argentea]|uniref:Protein FATTY ACID EXPORT 3, chloroplastic isoform X2 n=1 Tax=Rhodamnia argentea TaxID=178133 RepID=A0A8B8PWW0_9MYRT|nr:protein FATTY ACID EXPORT 3, chloroplastic isoform X2 [Rhodamnia argentea]